MYFVRATDDSGNDSELSDAALVSYDCVSGEWKAEYFDGTKSGWCGGGVGSVCRRWTSTSGRVPRRRLRSVGADTFSIRFTQQVDSDGG